MANKKLLPIALAGAAVGTGIYAYQKHKRSDIDGHGQTVLITGASGGIGKELARVFAKHGFDLVLVARSADKLQAFAEELEREYRIKATPVPADLSAPDGAQKLYDEVSSRGIRIDQLVNNAGAGKAGRTVDTDVQTMVDLIHLNSVSVTVLCRLFGADMVRRGNGKILIVSSLGAFIPDPYFNVYGPTKAYDLFLGEALAGELSDSGISVSVLCPGPTKTNWAHNAGKADSNTALDSADVARIGFEGLQNGSLVIIPTPMFKAEKVLMGLLPQKAQVAFITRWQRGLIDRKAADA